MKHQAYVKEQRQNPDYVKAEEDLQPVLDLADDIVRLRMERGWTQEELAEKMGTYQANISKLEHGLANPTLETLQKLSEVFEVTLEIRLVDDRQNESAPTLQPSYAVEGSE